MVGYVDEDEVFYESLESGYGIANVKGLGIGESTCEAALKGREPRSCPTCPGPLFDVAALSRIAMRRCATALCAIHTMGSLAEEHGYYGAGEALTIADGLEAWMFHILPDDTGLSAVWCAQRVPDDHIAVVANAFVIRTEADLCSANAEDVALRTGLHPGGRFDFAKSYGPRPDNTAYPYSTHRVWRVFTMFGNLTLGPHHDYLGSEMPFSLRVRPLHLVKDVLRMQRDYFEGTPFDLTKGLAAGAWGDPTRYDPIGTTGGRFERAISMFRTSYSIAVQGNVTWFAPGAPHASIYQPLNVEPVPATLMRGSLFQVSEEDCLWWTVDMIANWIRANTFKLAIEDVRKAQSELELAFYDGQRPEIDWKLLLDKLITKYRDGYVVRAAVVEPNVTRAFYPEAWLRQVGYYTPLAPDAYSLHVHQDKLHFDPTLIFVFGVLIGALAVKLVTNVRAYNIHY